MPKNKIESFFDRYFKIMGKRLPDPKDLTQEQKIALAHQLCHAGESKMAVADYFGVTRQTIHAWIAKQNTEVIAEIEAKTFLSLFAEQVADLQSRRDLYRKVISNLTDNEETTEMDPATGIPVTKTTHLRSLAEMGRLARDYDKMLLELFQYVGFIPKGDTAGLFTTLKDHDPKVKDEEKLVSDLSDDELDIALLRALTQKVDLSLGITPLKKLKDVSVL